MVVVLAYVVGYYSVLLLVSFVFSGLIGRDFGRADIGYYVSSNFECGFLAVALDRVR